MRELVAAFDASGKETDQSCVAVDGFIATSDEWDKFSSEMDETTLRRRIVVLSHARICALEGPVFGSKLLERGAAKAFAFGLD